MKPRQALSLAAVPALLLAGATSAHAMLIYTLNDPAHGVSATATFQPVAGGFEMTVTNTEANTVDASKAISQIQFSVGGGMGPVTGFTELSGNVTDFSSPPTFQDFKPPNAAQHWQFATPGSNVVTMLDVGATGPGFGQASYLIGAAGSTPNSSLTNTHTPSFVGPVNFFFADAMVPSNLNFTDITGVSFSFGTRPEVSLDPASPGGNPAVPEPATLTLLGTGGGISLLALAWRRRKLAAEVAG